MKENGEDGGDNVVGPTHVKGVRGKPVVKIEIKIPPSKLLMVQ